MRSCTAASAWSMHRLRPNELVPRGGLDYVVYLPMPELVVLPFVALFGSSWTEGFVSVLLGAANRDRRYLDPRWMGVRRRERVILSLVFAFGTIVWYSAAAGSSWHFAHVVATCCMLLAIRACQLDARPALIGFLFGAAVIPRACRCSWRRRSSWPTSPTVPTGPKSGDTTVFGSLLAERPAAWLSRPDWRSAFEFLARPLAAGVGDPAHREPTYMILIWDAVRVPAMP